jgi:LacI family transcriptional regulator
MKLEDIARLAGVSRSTVSRVINNDPNVSEKTRAHVLQVIAENHYVPNTAARALVTQRSCVLGLYIPYQVGDLFTDPFFPVLIQALTSRANAQDYDVMLWLKGTQTTLEGLHQRVLDNRMTDGLVLASTFKGDPLPEALLQRGRTFILAGRPWQHEDRINYVDAANEDGAEQAVEHLARLGRRRIATITGRLDVIAGRDRLAGYRKALDRLGLERDPALEVGGDFSEAGAYLGMQRLLPHQPDAVFVASDHMGLGALRAIHEAGLRVPDDIALVGFDDMPFATLARPQLTTVRQPVAELGSRAAGGLIGLIEGTLTPPHQVALPTELVIRESCGFPA